MSFTEKYDTLRRTAKALAVIGFTWVFFRWIFGWFLPFLLAVSVAACWERLILRLQKTLRWKRCFSAAILTVLFVGGTLTITVLLAAALLQQTTEVLASLPRYLQAVPELMDSWIHRLREFSAAGGSWMQQWAERGLSAMTEQLGEIVGHLSEICLQAVRNIIGAAPGILLFTVTTALALFFASCRFPDIRTFVQKQCNAAQLQVLAAVRKGALVSAGKWLRAQALLLGITFCELLLGFLLLHQPYAMLLSAVIAFIDALPVFGTGTVLLPWALLCFTGGDVMRGVALTAMYAVIMLVRSIAEPKLMASLGGLPPLVSLCAMYVGFRVVGVGGMVLFPLLMLLFKQLQDSEIFCLWK